MVMPVRGYALLRKDEAFITSSVYFVVSEMLCTCIW